MRTFAAAFAAIFLVAVGEPSAVSSNLKLESAFFSYYKPPERKTTRGLMLVTKVKSRVQFVFHMEGKQPKSVEISTALLSSTKTLNRRSISARADLLCEWKVCEVYFSQESKGETYISIEPYRGKAPGRYLALNVKPNGTVEWIPSE